MMTRWTHVITINTQGIYPKYLSTYNTWKKFHKIKIQIFRINIFWQIYSPIRCFKKKTTKQDAKKGLYPLNSNPQLPWIWNTNQSFPLVLTLGNSNHFFLPPHAKPKWKQRGLGYRVDDVKCYATFRDDFNDTILAHLSTLYQNKYLLSF